MLPVRPVSPCLLSSSAFQPLVLVPSPYPVCDRCTSLCSYPQVTDSLNREVVCCCCLVYCLHLEGSILVQMLFLVDSIVDNIGAVAWWIFYFFFFKGHSLCDLQNVGPAR